ncbi:hypothetical protein P7K49_012817, partial [Saguinus oedipus]
ALKIILLDKNLASDAFCHKMQHVTQCAQPTSTPVVPSPLLQDKPRAFQRPNTEALWPKAQTQGPGLLALGESSRNIR